MSEAASEPAEALPVVPSTAPDPPTPDLVELEQQSREAKRQAVAATTGVPAALLAGDNQEAMTAHAERLLAWAHSLRPPAFALPMRPRERLTPAPVDDFDPQAIARRARGER